MVTTLREAILKLWALTSLALLAVILALYFPAVRQFIEMSALTGFVAQCVPVGAALVAGFWVAMLFDCGLARDVQDRGHWLIAMFILPVVSTYAYFYWARWKRGKLTTSHVVQKDLA